MFAAQHGQANKLACSQDVTLVPCLSRKTERSNQGDDEGSDPQ